MKKIISTILSGCIAYLFAVAPAFAANNDPSIDRGRSINRTESSKVFEVARRKRANSKLSKSGSSRGKSAWDSGITAILHQETKLNSLGNRTGQAGTFTQRNTMTKPQM